MIYRKCFHVDAALFLLFFFYRKSFMYREVVLYEKPKLYEKIRSFVIQQLFHLLIM